MKKKIALVVPLLGQDSSLAVEYLGFGYIASYLRSSGIEVEIIDAYVEGLTKDQIVNRLINGSFDLIGFTLMSSDFLKGMNDILDGLLEEGYDGHITIGGYYTSFYGEKILSQNIKVSSAIIGEGEKTFLNLIENLDHIQKLKQVEGLIIRHEGKLINTGKRALMSEAEMDKLPIPSRESLRYLVDSFGVRQAQVIASRGCYGNCGFCAVNKYVSSQEGKRWRGRSPQSIVEEIEYLVREFNINYIYFADEEFIGNNSESRERAKEIGKLIIKKELKIHFCIFCRVTSVDEETFRVLRKAGMDRVFIGIEFGYQRALDFYNKGVTVEDNIKAINILKKLGVNILAGFIFFEPLMNLREFLVNLKFFYENLPFKLKYLVRSLAIYDNTLAYQKLKNEIQIDKENTFDFMAGDSLKYSFKDNKVESLLRILKECLVLVSPSKRYTRIIKEHSGVNRKKEIDQWSYQLYKLIENIVLKIDEIEVFTKEEELKIKAEFKDLLLSWDKSTI